MRIVLKKNARFYNGRSSIKPRKYQIMNARSSLPSFIWNALSSDGEII